LTIKYLQHNKVTDESTQMFWNTLGKKDKLKLMVNLYWQTFLKDTGDTVTSILYTVQYNNVPSQLIKKPWYTVYAITFTDIFFSSFTYYNINSKNVWYFIYSITLN